MKKIFTVISILFAFAASAQWVQVTNPSSHSLNDVYFVSSTTGYVLDSYNNFFKTTDGGSTWTSGTSIWNNPTLAANFSRLSFSDSLHGFACSSNGFVVATADGGLTGVERSTPDTPTTLTQTTANLNSIYFTDNNTGWVVGDSGYVWKTTNAGVSWTKQTSGTTQNLWSVRFLDANNGWLCGYGGTILKTTNGGSTWTAATGASGAIKYIFPVSSTKIFAGDGAGYITKSTDGSTFNGSVSTGLIGVKAIWMVDANNGYAVGMGGLVTTSNGGTSWQSISLSGVGSSSILNSISRAGKTTWICGPAGFFKNSSNVGINEIMKTENIFSVYPNPSNGNFEINFNSNENGTANIFVTDLAGKIIYSDKEGQINSGKYIINLSDKNSGIYFCSVQTNSGVHTQKLIINK